MSVARFRTGGRLEMASRYTSATVTVDREAGLVHVRPLRRRRVYTMPLSAVAEWIVRRTILAELAEKRRARRARRST